METFEPGQIIVPHDPPQPAAPPTESLRPAQPIPPASAQEQPTAVQPDEPSSATLPPVAGSTGDTEPQVAATSPVDTLPAMTAEAARPNSPQFSWSASEGPEFEKDMTWYGFYTLGTILIGALVYFVTRDVISSAVVFVAILGLLSIIAKKPQEQSYAIKDDQVALGSKIYNFRDFHAFSVDESGTVAGITLWPLKRFLPPITLHLPPEKEETIIDYLSIYLPIEVHQIDPLDKLLKKLRF